jgi:hypothetical protein
LGVAEPKADRAGGKLSDAWKAQAGNVDPGMAEAGRQKAVTGE